MEIMEPLPQRAYFYGSKKKCRVYLALFGVLSKRGLGLDCAQAPLRWETMIGSNRFPKSAL
jgi:hypothetical protein